MNKPEVSKRRFFSPQDKMQVLKRHLVERVPVSDLCDELGIGPNLFYRWQRELFEGGEAVFANDRQSKAADDAKNREIERLQAKLLRKNEVLAELMEEHVQLKKELGEP